MKETYTTTELCRVLGLTRKAVLDRATGEKWEKLPNPGGRGGGFCFPISRMPQATRLAIQTAEARRAAEQEKGLVPVAPAPLALTHPDYNTLILEDKRRNKALAKADLVRFYLDWQKRHGFTVAQKEAFVLAYLGGTWGKLLAELGPLSWKSLENWKLQHSREGNVLALADKRGIAHKGRSQLTEKHTVIILGQFLNPNKPNIAQCYRQIKERCKAEGLWVPSEPTVRRYVKDYSEECNGEFIYWREGRKAWNDKCAISILRDWTLVEVGDIVFADGHTLNFETLDPNTGKAKRMTLLLFYDGASNCPLGWEIMATENTACIASAFRRACIMLGKFPRVVYLDNGLAFRAKFFKGTPDFSQAGISGLYTSLGCAVIHAWPYHGQSKTIERFFGSFHDMEVFVPSYSGNSIATKPARMMRGEVMHRQLYDKMGGRPLTLEETHKAVALWFAEYARRPQARTHLAGRTPGEVLEAGRGPGVDMKRLTLLMMRKVIKAISKDGIRHQGRLYWDEALANRRHPVVILYDDLKPHEIFVYTQDGQHLICEARDREYYGIAAGIHPVAYHLGTEEQQRAFQEAMGLKKHQQKGAEAGFQAMLHSSILPELEQRQAALEATSVDQGTKAIPVLPAPEPRQLSAEETAAFEAAQEKARLQYEAESDPNYYEPAFTKRFMKEAAKYDYLFKVKHEKGIELVTEDEAWMQAYEASPEYERYHRKRYGEMKEYFDQVRSA